MANYNAENTAIPEEERSYFDGGYFAYIGCSILVGFVTAITLGIAYPWMCCWFENWKAKHTVVCGKRMYFDGKGLQLIGKYLLWGFLSVITFGIYGLWMSVSMKKWIAKHTHYQGEADNNSYFDGGVLGLLGTNILSALVAAVPVVGLAWSKIIKLRWETKHTVVDSRRHIFVGTVGGLFVKYLLWGLLSCITFGIFAWFMPVKVMRWETENKIDNEHTTQELIARGEYRANIHTDAASFKTYKVEDDMECVKAGITDTLGQDELLALANSGVRSAQYTYVVRYAQQQYTHEPFTSLLRAAAEAEYAPAMCLYLQTHTMDADTRTAMLQKAADKGQTWSIKASMTAKAQEALALKEDKNALPALKCAVRYADLLKENKVELSTEEAELLQKCVFAIRRIQSALPPSSSGKIVGIVVGVLVGLPMAIGIVIAVAALFTRTTDHTYSEASTDYYSYDGQYYEDAYDISEEELSDAVADEKSGGGLLSIFGSLFGGDKDLNGSNMAGLAAQDQIVQEDYDTEQDYGDQNDVISSTDGEESDFWKRFKSRVEEDYCVVSQVDTASDGTVKYEITCEQYFWKSLHYMEIKQDGSGVQKMSLWGVRVFEPDGPDPTMNEVQWTTIVREIYKQLDLGDYEDITPYTANGSSTVIYGDWIFTYDNNDSEVRVTISRI